MLRSEIIASLEKLSKLLNDINPREIIGPTTNDKLILFRLIIDAYKSVVLFNTSVNSNDTNVIRALGLRDLLNDDLWQKAIYEIKAEKETNLFDILYSASQVPKILPGLFDIIAPDVGFLTEPGTRYIATNTSELLRIVLPEEGQSLSSPKRVVNAINSVNDIYVAVCKMNDMPDNNLALVACDSGSDKAFDFIGLSKAMETVKEIILSVWDRIIYYREHKFSTRIDLVIKALPVLEQVNDFEMTGKMSREQAHIIKEKLTSGIRFFLESGCVIPEMANASFSPSSLLQTSPGLLLPAPTVMSRAAGTAESHDQDIEGSSADDPELAEALRLVRSRKRGPTNNPDESGEHPDDRPARPIPSVL